MEYNWSWLPPRTATTPPPVRPDAADFVHVDVLREANDRHNQVMSQHFVRSFPHDDFENEGDHESIPMGLALRDDVADFHPATANINDDDSDGIDNDEIGDENVEDVEVTGDEEAEEDEGEDEEPPFDPASVGLKEISNLANFTVSSYKPGCGVQALRDDDPHLFWQ